MLCAVAIGSGALLVSFAATAAPRECGDDAGPNLTRVPCACGDTVVTTTGLRMTDPVVTGACSGDGLHIGANDILLTCRSRAIVGAGTEGTTGIVLSGRRGVTISKCRIEHFGNGIDVFGGSDNEIKDNSLRDIGRAAIAIGDRVPRDSASDANRVARNSIKRARFGILIVEGANNNVDDNIVRDCDVGIVIAGPDSLVTDNYVKRTRFGIGLFEDSNRSLVEDNAVRDSGSGIRVDGTRDSRIHQNSVKLNDVGIDLFDEAARVEVSENRVSDNGVGISIELNVNGVLLVDNRIKRSEGSGILIGDGPSGLTFTVNSSEDNGRFGIDDAGTGRDGGGRPFEYVDNECDGNTLGPSSPAGLCE